jgi:DNA-binding IclR family transcriptional regulator
MPDGGGKDPREGRYIVPALARGIEVLELLAASREAVAPSDMARALGIPRSTVFRLLQTLEAYGLIGRTEHGNAFRLGPGVTRLGFAWLASLDVTEAGRAPLEALRDRTGHSCHLAVRDGAEAVVVLRAPGRGALTGSFSVGTRVPTHASVLGRMLLMDLPEAELRALFPGEPLRAFSPQTPTTLAALKARIAEDRARGHGVSEGYFESGVSAVAAPVRDAGGRVVASINATLFGGARINDALIAEVIRAASEISRALGHAAGEAEA